MSEESVKGIEQDGATPPLVAEVKQTAGDLDARGLRFGIVVSRFNGALTSALADAAIERLHARGAAADAVELAWVPGAYEAPFVVERWAREGRFDAVLALGCVIQGETPHAGLINRQVALSLADIARRHDVPVIDGVVTANTEAQAVARCRRGPDCRGHYAADAAVEMARLIRRLGEAT